MLSQTFAAVMLTSSLAGLVTLAGIYAISRHSAWARRYATYFKGFAAGMLIAISFIHVIPKSFELHEGAPVALLVGFMAIYLVNRLLKLYTCRDEEAAHRAAGFVPALGIGIHSLVDGLIYSVTFNVSLLTGGLSALGMVCHEFPEGIVTYALLKQAGFERRWALGGSLLMAAASTPLGTLISFPFVSHIQPASLGLPLALSAGVLIYVGATHLLPEIEEGSVSSLVALGTGVSVALLIVLLKGAS